MLLSIIAFSSANAQELKTVNVGNFNFTVIHDLEATSVDNQNRSSTCWSYSSLSFLESELLRQGKGKYNLSEMYVVRKAYEGKADKYVRMHGTQGFAAGGAFHDMLWVWKNYGLVPNEAYPGNTYDDTLLPIHWEMDEALKAFVSSIIQNKNGKLSHYWKSALNGILDAYLGKEPASFSYQKQTYSPQSFAQHIGLNADDYVSITSFTHHPYYQTFAVEVPDNWAAGLSYNVTLDDFKHILEYAIKSGYTIAWGADVSEKGFSFVNGVAVVPQQSWKEMDKAMADSMVKYPIPQLNITPEIRQYAFDNYETQDDHGMHITGLVKDQKGTVYYKVKNSWGTSRNSCGGYLYASEAYVLYKTTNILLHKNALPKDIRSKLKL